MVYTHIHTKMALLKDTEFGTKYVAFAIKENLLDTVCYHQTPTSFQLLQN